MRLISILFLLLALLSSACSTPQAASKKHEIFELPEAYSTSSQGSPMDEGWCGELDDGPLGSFLDEALANNLNIKASWARLEQTEAIARAKNASLWPVAEIRGEAGYARTALPKGMANSSNQYKISLAASYELDIWGKLEAQREAASFDVQATRADIGALAITTAAEVSEAWFDILYQRERRTLIETQLRTNQAYLELVLSRMALGQASILDITQQKQQIESTLAQLTLVEQQELAAKYRLAMLLGRTPNDLTLPDIQLIPELEPTPSVGLPASLLERRPDLQAAQLRLSAADSRLAVAVRDQLPSVKISGSISFQSFDIEELFTQLLWSLGTSIAQPLLDGGRRAAEVERVEALSKELLYRYAQVLLNAIREVETSLASEAQQKLFLEHLEAQTAFAQRALELSRDRYRRGGLDYLRVLTSLQALQRLEQQNLDVRRQQLSFRIQLCRATGGDWTKDMTPSDSTGGPR